MNWTQYKDCCYPSDHGQTTSRDPLSSLFSKIFISEDDFFHSRWAGTPRVDIKETEEAFELSAELPGRSEEEINIELSGNMLTISSKMDDKKEEEKDNYRRRERNLESFSRSFDLPDNIDKENISASFRNGILAIQLPRTPESKPQKIKIQLNN